MNRKLTILAGLTLIALSVWALVSLQRTDQSANESTSSTLTRFNHESTGVSLDYDSKYAQAISLTEQDTKDRFILRLTDKGGANKPFLFNIRYEDNLAAASAITKQPVLNHLESSANLALPQKDGYKLLSSERTEIAGQESLKYIFTYTANKDTTAKQQLLIIPLNNDRAIYISQQAIVEDYDTINQQVFDPILETLKLQR